MAGLAGKALLGCFRWADKWKCKTSCCCTLGSFFEGHRFPLLGIPLLGAPGSKSLDGDGVRHPLESKSFLHSPAFEQCRGRSSTARARSQYLGRAAAGAPIIPHLHLDTNTSHTPHTAAHTRGCTHCVAPQRQAISHRGGRDEQGVGHALDALAAGIEARPAGRVSVAGLHARLQGCSKQGQHVQSVQRTAWS